MKVFCSSCSKFIAPYECSVLGVPTGPKKCNRYDRRINLYPECKDCEHAWEPVNVCSYGFDFKNIKQCPRRKEKDYD